MQKMTFDAFWTAANIALAHRDSRQMLFGEARDAFAAYCEDAAARGYPDVAEISEG